MTTSAGEFFNAASWLLGRNAAATPDRVAVTAIDAGGSATDVTYRELDDLAWQAAAALVAAAIRAEERILLCMADSPELLAPFLGGLYIGTVPVPVSLEVLDGIGSTEALHIFLSSFRLREHALEQIAAGVGVPGPAVRQGEPA